LVLHQNETGTSYGKPDCSTNRIERVVCKKECHNPAKREKIPGLCKTNTRLRHYRLQGKNTVTGNYEKRAGGILPLYSKTNVIFLRLVFEIAGYYIIYDTKSIVLTKE